MSSPTQRASHVDRRWPHLRLLSEYPHGLLISIWLKSASTLLIR